VLLVALLLSLLLLLLLLLQLHPLLAKLLHQQWPLQQEAGKGW
jgi:hypothetical protein